jgi:hypothetical protein
MSAGSNNETQNENLNTGEKKGEVDPKKQVGYGSGLNLVKMEQHAKWK